ncbi:FHA domain-containing protein [Streptacidiphilus sp. PB12-B1b]|uniref:FHA domain-containing protein n=1 Tax=Streptacidiphilus sp. PB12-B1b TaxID=2705012 RepID=UPI0015FCAD07|nr:FHA domain-containing protein [Streptacidiphilus sp. PB12-B1b]QMU75330.1 FHA domain-containing protein [Streptacidiphilus sp. PB12-B1b]
MQIRLSVCGPRDGVPPLPAHGQAQAAVPASSQVVDVLVTAPAGTALGAVAGALAGAVGGRQGARGGRAATHVQLYAGDQRLDERAVLGHPPLVDGALLRLDEPDPDHVPLSLEDSPAELRVVGGPDAGGIHLLQAGQVRVGRSSAADVPLDDPDVSRFHLLLDVSEDGRVTVADSGSTNGTTLDGRPVGPEPRTVPPGALIGLGESVLRIAPGHLDRADLIPDGQGQVQLVPRPAPPVPSGPRGRTATGTGAGAPEPAARPLASRARGLLTLRGRVPRPGAPLDPPLAAQGGSAAVSSSSTPTPASGVRLPALTPAVRSTRWPDPAELLLTALGPGPRLWERGLDHPDTLALRLGSTSRPAAPVVLDLRAVGSLGLTGPRHRLTGLARALLAQLAVLHGPSVLELVLVSADPARPTGERGGDWSWLYWLPQLRPGRGQACRLLTALEPEQAQARLAELRRPVQRAGGATVLLVDGDPGSVAARNDLARVLAEGPASGVHAICLADHPDLLPRGCGATAAVTGEVGTLLTLERPVAPPYPSASGGHHRAHPARELIEGIALDAVSAAWAEGLARALAPLREADSGHRPGRGALPDAPRLLDLLGLDVVTPAQISSRWTDLQLASGTLPAAVVGADRDGPCGLDLSDHLLIGGAPGSGRTELLRTLLASLSVAERPDRLGVLLIEARPPQDQARGLRPCLELPQVTGYVDGSDELRLLHAAQALTAELDRRELLLQGRSFASWHAERALSRLAPPRRAPDDYPRPPGAGRTVLDTAPPSRLLVVVDDHDELLLPGRERAALAAALDAVALRGPRLGVHLAVATGHPDRSSGSELDEAAQLRVALRVDDPRLSSLLIHVEDAATVTEEHPGRGYVRYADGRVTGFQGARVSGRIPRTATLRPTVAPLDWAAMGDPPARRPVRELGNGPTDLALLASALQRAAETLDAPPPPPLL